MATLRIYMLMGFNKIKHLRTETFILALIFFLVLGLLIYKAINVPLSHDEAINYLDYIVAPYPKSLDLTSSNSSNNHLINTLLVKLLSGSVGYYSPLVARIPSLIGFAVFYLFLAKYLKSHKKIISKLIIFLVVINPLTIDLFQISRGYSIALAFAMIGFYYLSKSPTNYILISLAFLLSSLSSITFLYLQLAVFLTLLVTLILDKSQKRKLMTAIVGLSWTVFIPILIALALKQYNQYYYGGHGDFIADTLMSLVTKFLGQPGPGLLSAAMFISVFAGLSSITLSLHLLYKKRNLSNEQQLLLKLAFCLFLTVAIVIISHELIGIPYPLDRTAVYLLLIFGLTLGICLEALSVNRSLLVMLITITTLPLLGNLVRNFQTKQLNTLTGNYNEICYALSKYISEDTQPSKVFGNGYILYPCIAEYRYKGKDILIRSSAPYPNDVDMAEQYQRYDGYEYFVINPRDVEFIELIKKTPAEVVFQSQDGYLLLISRDRFGNF